MIVNFGSMFFDIEKRFFDIEKHAFRYRNQCGFDIDTLLFVVALTRDDARSSVVFLITFGSWRRSRFFSEGGEGKELLL